MVESVEGLCEVVGELRHHSRAVGAGGLLHSLRKTIQRLNQLLAALVDRNVDLKESVVAILTAIDTLLLATVLLVIGYGLYELFVDSNVRLPPWLEIKSLDDLKAKLIGVVVAIIAVVFLGVLVDSTDANDIMLIGIGAGAVVIGLAAFTYATRK